MSKYCLFLIVIYYLTGGNNSMSRFCKFGKLHVTKGNVDKLLGILLTASKELVEKQAIDKFRSGRQYVYFIAQNQDPEFQKYNHIDAMYSLLEEMKRK